MDQTELEEASQKVEKTLEAYGFHVERRGKLAILVSERENTNWVRLRLNGRVEIIEEPNSQPIARLPEYVLDALAEYPLEGEASQLTLLGPAVPSDE